LIYTDDTPNLCRFYSTFKLFPDNHSSELQPKHDITNLAADLWGQQTTKAALAIKKPSRVALEGYSKRRLRTGMSLLIG